MPDLTLGHGNSAVHQMGTKQALPTVQHLSAGTVPTGNCTLYTLSFPFLLGRPCGPDSVTAQCGVTVHPR